MGPSKNSVSSMDDPIYDPHELQTIKEQLIALHNTLLTQEYDLHLQMQTYKSKLEYHNQVILDSETENLQWTLQEILTSEYYDKSYINENALQQQQQPNMLMLQESKASL